MKLNDRSNYMIAVVFSLVFHLLLVLLFVSGYLASKSSHLETFPVGMVEIAKGSPDGMIGMTGTSPEKAENAPTVKEPEKNDKDKETANLKPKIIPKMPSTDALLIGKKEGNKPIDIPTKGPSANGSGNAGNGEAAGNGKPGSGKPFGFGSGEGMVTVLGPLPSNPKNAMNEGKEGDVALRILVKADGSLENIQLGQLSGDTRFDNAAISVIKRTWKFKPVAQNYYIDLVFSFRIDSPVASLKFINAESRP
jgi:TonB family protein